jgi:hypothetical protein
MSRDGHKQAARLRLPVSRRRPERIHPGGGFGLLTASYGHVPVDLYLHASRDWYWTPADDNVSDDGRD